MAHSHEKSHGDEIKIRKLLYRLFVLENVYKEKISWEEFQRKYSSYSLEEIEREVKKIEEKNRGTIQNLNSYVALLLAGWILRNIRGVYYSGLEDKLASLEADELLELYGDIVSGRINYTQMLRRLGIK